MGRGQTSICGGDPVRPIGMLLTVAAAMRLYWGCAGGILPAERAPAGGRGEAGGVLGEKTGDG